MAITRDRFVNLLFNYKGNTCLLLRRNEGRAARRRERKKKEVVNACEKEVKRSKEEENYWCIK